MCNSNCVARYQLDELGAASRQLSKKIEGLVKEKVAADLLMFWNFKHRLVACCGDGSDPRGKQAGEGRDQRTGEERKCA